MSARSSFAPGPSRPRNAPRDFRRPLEVQNAQLRPQVPVGFGRESNRRGWPQRTHFDVVFGAAPAGDGFVRQVRNAGQRLPELFVERVYLFVERRDALVRCPHRLLPFRGVGALLAQFPDLGGLDVLPRFELFGLGYRRPPPPVERAELLDVQGESALGQAR